MSSVFVNLNDAGVKSTGPFQRRGNNTGVWLQFVPGVVLDVITSKESGPYQYKNDINAIIAKSHIRSTKELNFGPTVHKKYIPLFRGMVDVPIKGDPVLLCTFGEIDYYLGPLNTINNPNFNPDTLGQNDSYISKFVKFVKSKTKVADGVSINFPRISFPRLQKRYNDTLDDVNKNKKAVKEIHGDMVFEGRHGNSIRIGSRDYNPYMIFSNGRSWNSSMEVSQNTSLIFMSRNGSIHEHFPWERTIPEGYDPEADPPMALEPSFWKLASDSVGDDTEDGQKRLIGADLYDYSYNKPQIFQNSYRITLNAEQDSMFLSSFSDMYLGSGNTMNLVSENETVIESSNIYLGRQARQKQTDGDIAEPLVLGEQLRIVLEEIVSTIETLKVTACVAGLSGPIDPPTINKIAGLKQKLADTKSAPFNSEYHFIEDNSQKPE